MSKFFAGVAAALLLAGAAYAGEPAAESEPAAEGEIVEVETTEQAVEAEAEAVDADVEAEGEVGPALAPAEDSATKEPAAE